MRAVLDSVLSPMARAIERSLLERPYVHIHQVDRRSASVQLVGVNRATLSEATFLDQGMGMLFPAALPVPLERMLTWLDERPRTERPINYIFHSAYCGSTLLARCLDATEQFLAYKEPLALTQLCLLGVQTASGRRLNPDPEWNRTLRLVVTALSRTFHPEQVSVVKPMDWCNSSMGDLLRTDLTRGAVAGLYLYSDLESFLCGVLPWPNRRATVRDRLPWAWDMMRELGRLVGTDPTKLDDARGAAYLWLAQQYNFLGVAEVAPESLRSLDCDVFFERPADTLHALARHFGKSLDPAVVQHVVSGSTLSTYSKSGPKRGLRASLGYLRGRGPEKRPRFSYEHRVAKIQQVSEQYAAEIEPALAWARAAQADFPLPERLPLALSV